MPADGRNGDGAVQLGRDGEQIPFSITPRLRSAKPRSISVTCGGPNWSSARKVALRDRRLHDADMPSLNGQLPDCLADAPDLDHARFLDPVEIPVVGDQDSLRLKTCRSVQDVGSFRFR